MVFLWDLQAASGSEVALQGSAEAISSVPCKSEQLGGTRGRDTSTGAEKTGKVRTCLFISRFLLASLCRLSMAFTTFYRAQIAHRAPGVTIRQSKTPLTQTSRIIQIRW